MSSFGQLFGGGGLPFSGGTLTGPVNFSGATNYGIRLSNLTTTQQNALAGLTGGETIFNATDNVISFYDGVDWNELTVFGSGAGLTNTDGILSIGAGAITNAMLAGSIADSKLATTYLQAANNLSDLVNAGTARTNLGLGSLATLNTVNNGNWSGTVLSGANGGTGVANTGFTITVAGNFVVATNGGTLAFPAAGTTMTVPAASDTLGGLGTVQIWTAQNTFAAGTITTSQPFTITQTWNAGGVTFKALLINVTNTASASASLLADIQLGSVTQMSLRADGLLSVGSIQGKGGAGTGVTGITMANSNTLVWVNGSYLFGGATTGAITGAFRLSGSGSTTALNFGGDTSAFPSIKRSGANLVCLLADNTAGGALILSGGGVTVANLPAAVQGGTAFATDSTVGIAAGLGLTVVGGGANKVPVYSDGTNWIVG